MDISYRSRHSKATSTVALFAPLPSWRAKVHELLKRTGRAARPIFQSGDTEFCGKLRSRA